MKLNIRGLIAAPFTPMRPDGSLNLAVVEQQAKRLLDDGVRGAFVCGTTGEGLSLSTAERMSVAQRWVEVAGEKLTIIVHVGHASLAESRALAEHAQRIGAAAIAAHATCPFRPASVNDAVDCAAQIASAAPRLPFYYYHIPALTGVTLKVLDVLQAAEGRIPTLAGIKFTFEDLHDFGRCLSWAGDRMDILFGRDEIMLAALALGAVGAVGSTYNFTGRPYGRLIEAFNRGDLPAARAEQAWAQEVIAMFVRFGGIAAMKAVMPLIGIDCGPARLPMRSPSAGQIDQMRAELDRLEFFKRIG